MTLCLFLCDAWEYTLIERRCVNLDTLAEADLEASGKIADQEVKAA